MYSFDPKCPYGDRNNPMGGVVHEGIHSLLADLPGCKNAAWFHEGGNTWLQQEMDSRRYGNFNGMGFLNAGSYIAPFMPIETYSGWLQDGSFGGPSAECVNMFNGSQQICTWRRLLGGSQYSNAFPVFLANTLGDGSVPWVWRYCKSRVLEGLADTIGNEQIRRLIIEYRTKQGAIVYGQPIFGGECKLKIDGTKKPANGVIFAVVCNLNYIYEGEKNRKAHYDYRLKMKKGITHLSSITKKWFNWETTISDPNALPVPTTTGIENTYVENIDIKIYPNPVQSENYLTVEFLNNINESVAVELNSIDSRKFYQNKINEQKFYIPTDILTEGLYILSLKNSNCNLAEKIIIKK